jgi:hypothetical protein
LEVERRKLEDAPSAPAREITIEALHPSRTPDHLRLTLTRARVDPRELKRVTVVPVSVKDELRGSQLDGATKQILHLVRAQLVRVVEPDAGLERNAGWRVVADEHVEWLVAEASQVRVGGRLLLEPARSRDSQSPVDGERPSEEAEADARKRKPQPTREVPHVLAHRDWRVGVDGHPAQVAMMLMVAVDPQQLKVSVRTCVVDSVEEASARRRRWIEPEVTKLENEVTGPPGRECAQLRGPTRVAVRVTRDKGAQRRPLR